jgi:ribosomal protein S12 methylthiotransferase
MTDRCDTEEAQRRAERVMDIQAEIMDEYNSRCLGKTMRVMCEGYDRYAELMFGRTFADSPEVDGKVFFTGGGVPGEFANVKIIDFLDGDLVGEIVSEEAE